MKTVATLTYLQQEVIRLNNLGAQYAAQGATAAAQETYHQALLLQLEGNDVAGMAGTHSRMAAAYASVGQKDCARDQYGHALACYREIRHKSGEAATQQALGVICQALGEDQPAYHAYRQALRLSRSLRNHSGQASALNGIGIAFYVQGKRLKAIDHLLNALRYAVWADDNANAAKAHNNLGVVCAPQGKAAEPLLCDQNLLLLQHAADDEQGFAPPCTVADFRRLGKNRSAFRELEMALPYACKSGDPTLEALIRCNVALLAARIGDLARAEQELEIVGAMNQTLDHPHLAGACATLEALRARGAEPA